MNQSISPVVKYLLIANVLFFVVGEFVFVSKQEFVNLLGLHLPFSDHFMPHQFVSHMFVHANFFHLLSNMFGLFVFGNMLEKFWGEKNFIIFYMICGVGAAALMVGVGYFETQGVLNEISAFLTHPDPEAFELLITEYVPNYAQIWPNFDIFMNHYYANPTDPESLRDVIDLVSDLQALKRNFVMIGASGAVLGIIAGFAMNFPDLQMRLLFPPIPVKAKYFALFIAAMSVVSLYQNRPDDNVAHLAHLGGMIFGALLVLLVKERFSVRR